MEALIPFAFVLAIMYVALILPQQRQAKAARELLASLSEGDEVVLNSGIHGFVNTIDGNILWIEVAEGVELKVSRSAVAHKLVDAEDDESADDESASEDSSDSGLGDTDTIEADD